MIFIAMLLGLRCSEILGLRWEDFDMKRTTGEWIDAWSLADDGSVNRYKFLE